MGDLVGRVIHLAGTIDNLSLVLVMALALVVVMVLVALVVVLVMTNSSKGTKGIEGSNRRKVRKVQA